jgi:Wadjet protein JetA
MIFGKLPDEIFRPLAGPNRYIMEKVLKQLYLLFYDDENPESDTPRKNIVMNELHQILIMENRLSVEDEECAGQTFDAPATVADYIFRRLVNTGWLELEEDGYITNVVFNPNAALLLEALNDIESREKKSYGRVVVSILSHLEAVLSDPKDRGLVFFDAVNQTRNFSNHLRSIIYSLKEVQDRLASFKDPRHVLSNFFDEFVENILIADYKTLSSEDNPFRFRSQILSKLDQIEWLRGISPQLTEHYVGHYNISPEEASSRLKRDIDFIRKVFKSIDNRLDRIDSFRFRLESRVGETVRFMDRTLPGMTARVTELLSSFSNNIEDPEALIPGPPRCNQIKLLGEFSLTSPRGKKDQPTTQVLRKRELNPDAKEYRQKVREFLKKRNYEPLRVTQYLNQQMGNNLTMSANDFTITNIEDLLSFLLIRRLPMMRGRGELQARQFTIQKKPNMIETEWVSCRDFTVERAM